MMVELVGIPPVQAHSFSSRLPCVHAFFHSDGGVDSDELLRQLIIVITACEFVGVHVKLQMSDAGGANECAIRLLTETGGSTHKHGEPVADDLCFINPMDPSRVI